MSHRPANGLAALCDSAGISITAAAASTIQILFIVVFPVPFLS